MPCTVTVEDGPHRLTLAPHGPRHGRPGLLRRWSSPRRAGPSGPRRLSRSGATGSSSRVTYLMEPLKVLEIDAGGGEVQIRSQSPTARDAERGYYEMRLFRQGILRMERFTFDEQAASAASRPASSRARSWNAWPTTSPPAWSEFAGTIRAMACSSSAGQDSSVGMSSAI